MEDMAWSSLDSDSNQTTKKVISWEKYGKIWEK
jgi:hypothetical protein